MTKKDKDSSLPWAPADYEPYHVEAIQMLSRGECPEHLQKLILEWIITGVCDAYGLSFRPEELGGDRATVFAEGKRHVGMQIVKMLQLKPATLRNKTGKTPTEQGT